MAGGGDEVQQAPRFWRGVPVYIVDIYRLGFDAPWEDRLRWAPERLSPQDPASVGLHVYRRARGLLMLVLCIRC